MCGDERDVIDGKATGAVRISFGWHSTYEDADAFVSFVRARFMQNIQESLPTLANTESKEMKNQIILTGLWIYPVKGMPGIQVSEWEVF